MFWFLNNNNNNNNNIFYQVFENTESTTFNNCSCYNLTKKSIKKNLIEPVIVKYDIFIKDNLIKYVNDNEEKTFMYEISKINTDSKTIIFKNNYIKTNACKLPLLLDRYYDNIYKNSIFKIYKISPEILLIENDNNECLLTSNECLLTSNECLLTSNECLLTSNECLLTSNIDYNK
jgi:hypothetical protein